MAGEKEPRKRTAFGPHYCPEDLLSEVNAIPEIASAITGTEKVYAIKKSFDFFHQWKDKVEGIGKNASGEASARIAELESQLNEAEQSKNGLIQERDEAKTSLSEKENRISELEEQLSQKEEELANAQNASDEEKDQRIAELEEQLSQKEAELADAQNGKPSWDAIRKTIDPVYADMMEYMSNELGADDPLRMAIDIFVKYHVKRYTELPFQPFIPVKTLDEIIRSNYPDMSFEKLQKQLK